LGAGHGLGAVPTPRRPAQGQALATFPGGSSPSSPGASRALTGPKPPHA
jgi:hypothetical protein